MMVVVVVMMVMAAIEIDTMVEITTSSV